MALLAFTDGFVLLNATNISTNITTVTLEVDVADLDVTAMGGSYKSHLGGLKEGKLSLTLNQDFAAAALDSIVWPLLGTVVTFEVRPTSGARSTSNPAYTGSCMISQWIPLDGKVGDLAQVKVTWPTSGTVLRQTS